MEDSRAEFTKDDMELLAHAQRETDAEERAAAAVEADASPAALPAPVSAPVADPAPAPAPEAAPAHSPTPAPMPAEAREDHGSPRAALRAARRAERHLREENAALRRQLEASSAAAASQAPKEPDESQLNDVREYAPAVGEHIDHLKAENDRLRALLPPPTSAEPGFVPEVLPDDVQEAVDDMPELLDWQTNPEHAAQWARVKKEDAYLMGLDEWRGVSYKERFAHAVERTKSALAIPSNAPAPSPVDAARARIAAAAAAPAAPVTLGDLRGGQPPASVSPRDPYEMVKAGKTDEEILASLPVY